jgi:sugar lactone lactonase YvrE
MAYDAGAKRWFVSSVRQRRIFAIDAKGTSKPFVENLPFGAFGLVYDKPRGVLWAASSALAQVEGVKKEDFGRSSLLKIDGRTGRVLETIGAPDAERHHFNDVALGADGSVYVSDGGTSTVLRLRGKSLETFAQGPFVSLQGLAVDGPTMYVADYSKGLYAVDIATRAIRLLRVPDDVTFLGIDGLYVAGRRTLMATQNGVAPNRVVRIRLSADGLGIEKMETLLANMPGFGDPTLGVVAGDRFYFNANAQWDLYADDGSISDPVKLQNPVVMWVPVR